MRPEEYLWFVFDNIALYATMFHLRPSKTILDRIFQSSTNSFLGRLLGCYIAAEAFLYASMFGLEEPSSRFRRRPWVPLLRYFDCGLLMEGDPDIVGQGVRATVVSDWSLIKLDIRSIYHSDICGLYLYHRG